MAKDRYSDDHTIEIVGDTNTLTINDNLNVSGTLSGNIDTDSITSSGDLTISAAGSITLDSDSILFTSVPELASVETRYKSYPAAAFTAQPDSTSPSVSDFYYAITDGWVWNVSGSNRTLILTVPILDLPQGSVIKSITLAYERPTADDQITVDYMAKDISTGTATSIITFYLPSAASYSTYTHSISIGSGLNYEDYFSFIRVQLNLDSGGTGIRFYGLRISYETDSVGK
jgi:hypothetical protein